MALAAQTIEPTESEDPVSRVLKLIRESAASADDQQALLKRIVSAGVSEFSPDDKAQKSLLRAMTAENWPNLPTFSTLQAPLVEEVQKATVGTGAVLTFKEHGVQKVVMMKAGTHYEGPFYNADPAVPTFMIPGGFINLTETPGSTLVQANPAKAEDPRVGATREIEEELVDDKNEPILRVDPSRLKPMDTKTLTFKSGERRVVIGLMLELTPEEVKLVKDHVAKLETDETYRHAVRAHTINPESGKPEVCTVSILPLKEIVEGRHKLLYPDQKSLFENVSQHLTGTEITR